MLTMHNTFSYFVNGNMRFYIETFNRAQKKNNNRKCFNDKIFERKNNMSNI